MRPVKSPSVVGTCLAPWVPRERMAALFPEWSNTVFRVALVFLAMLIVGVIGGPMVCMRTPYNTMQFVPVEQPVEFDHRHHVRDDDIACLYCHAGAEVSARAGIPSTDLCMGCHAQIWNQSPQLEPVRQSYFSGVPIPWRRVHDLPDFVYFHHAIHVRGGIDCVVCHGRVDMMPLVYRVASLSMGWCLDCHRNPQAYLERTPGLNRPPDQRSMTSATINMFIPKNLGKRDITRLTTCTACHR